MKKTFCDVCCKEIVNGSPCVKVYVEGESYYSELDVHISCLDGDSIRDWLDLSKVGKVSIVEVDEGDAL